MSKDIEHRCSTSKTVEGCKIDTPKYHERLLTKTGLIPEEQYLIKSPHLKDGSITANLNIAADQIIEHFRHVLIRNGLDPVEIPSAQFKWLAWNFNLTNGWLEDLSTISKGGDVLATYTSRTRTITIEFPLSFDSLMFSYKFERYFIFHHRGDIFGKVEDVKIDCQISFNYGTYQLKLDHFQIKDKSKLSLHYSGTGIFHWVTEKLINFTIGILHNPLISIIESSVKGPLEVMLITVNKYLADNIVP
ncbi:unnamed protein product [Acanthoscelides obtectus]|uniref:Uncharacterized protein n=1 Tax=Acanthoscelides obtectus TaxID=200917 RepID=A0A9P0LMW6_ACAOB|nr:unnamed protein product [Acanthoscelides obtectus]CAK1677823.1 hypothetical protein AOBTE_LOCUS31575 [Acanthoscelides obtectus]